MFRAYFVFRLVFGVLLGAAMALLGPVQLQAQTFRFERFSVNDGLASSTVFDIAQDGNGVIWVATELGLCRFNGSRFQSFGVLDGLPGNAIYELDIDSRDRVWLSTFSHAGYWHDRRFHRVPLEAAGLDGRVSSMVPDQQEHYWFSGSGAIWRAQDTVVEMFRLDGENENQRMRSIGLIQGDSIWMLSGDHVDRWDGKRLERMFETPAYMSRVWMLQDPQGLDYLVTSIGIWQRSRTATGRDTFVQTLPELSRFLTDSVRASTVFIDPEGHWWIGTFDAGLWYVAAEDLETGKARQYLEEASVQVVFQDRDDNLWIGTQSRGLYLLSYRARRVGNLRGNPPERLAEAFRKSVRGADGIYWVGRQKRRLSCVVGLHPNGDSVVVPSVGRIFEASRGPGNSVLLGTTKGLFQVDWESAQRIAAMEGQHRNVVAAAVLEQLAVFPVPTRTLWHDSLSGETWFYSMSGMHRLWPDGRLDTLRANAPARNMLVSDITGVAGGGRVWWSSYGRGLFLYDGDSLQRFGLELGLNSTSLIGVWLDNRGAVWTIGSNGVNRIEGLPGPSPKVYSLYEDDGLVMGEVRDGFLQDDTVWLRTNAGLTYFPADLIDRQPLSEPGIEMDRILISDRDTTILPEYQLNYRQNDLELAFSAVAFTDSRQVRYHYRVLGLDDEWQVSAFGEIRLSKLSPGTYTVEVLAMDVYGMQSRQPLRTVFRIRPAWWQRPIAQAGGGLLLLLMTGGVVNAVARRRARQREDRLILEKQLAETEQKALRAQMNPHFIYNVLNSIQQFVLRNDTEAALDYLAEFGDLIRRSFENSKRMAIPLKDEIDFLRTYLMLEKMRFDEELDYQIDVEGSIDIHKTFVPSLLIQPFVENSVRHGLRHRDGGGRIEVAFYMEPLPAEAQEALPRRNPTQAKPNRYKRFCLVCRIEDNGVGIDEDVARRAWMAEEHRATGMAITRNRLELFNRVSAVRVGMEVTNLQQEGRMGTRVVLTIPILEEEQTRATDANKPDHPLGDRRRRAQEPGFSS